LALHARLERENAERAALGAILPAGEGVLGHLTGAKGKQDVDNMLGSLKERVEG